jgi:hypothetical protein
VTPALTEALTGVRDYDELPASIKTHYTLKEWRWLSDDRKGTLIQDETEPEWNE